MNAYWIAILVFGLVFVTALLGMRLRVALPQHHLSEETKDAVRIGMGLVATMAALILGLLVASAKGSYDTEKAEINQMAARVSALDAILKNYGPEAQAARQALRQALQGTLVRIWKEAEAGHEPMDPSPAWNEVLPKSIQALRPQNDTQRSFKDQAVSSVSELGEMRWLLFEQTESSISSPLLFVVIAWLAIIFGSIGLFAPSNATAVGALFLSAVSVAGAIFLILELDQPFGGLIQISNRPLVRSLEHIQHSVLTP